MLTEPDYRFLLSSPPRFSSSNPPYPPPPSGSNNPSSPVTSPSVDLSNSNFAEITLEELSAFTPQMLNSMSLKQRNRYTLRLKELQKLEKMTPSEHDQICLTNLVMKHIQKKKSIPNSSILIGKALFPA